MVTKTGLWTGTGAFTFTAWISKVTPDYVWTTLAVVLFMMVATADYRN